MLMHAQIQHVLSLYPSIDSTKVYAWGTNNGAFMAFQLACYHADIFSAVAGFGGALNDPGDSVGISAASNLSNGD